jgi:hypothetical protein
MAHHDRRFSAAAAHVPLLFLFLVLFCAMKAPAQSLQTIDPPQGGKIVYGQVAGETTEAGAMGAVLKSLHTSLGDKPQVGKLFQVRGTESIAVFFSVNRKIGGSGQIAGLLIVTKVTSDHVEAALVSDEATRFPKTLSPMMKTLFGVWHPFAGAGSGGLEGSEGANGSVAPLHEVALPDRSASIGLPDGWQIVPNQSGGGTIVAQGPNGESAALGVLFLSYDTNNPRVQQTMRIVQNGGLRNTAYANGFYYPYGGNLEQAFVATLQHARQKNGLPPADYNYTSAMPIQGPPRQRCIHMEGTADFKDGVGTRDIITNYCVGPPTPAGGIWGGLVYSIAAPVKVAPKERATMIAILQSFNTNEAVVQQQARQYAQPEIDRIHAIGRASEQQAREAHEREDIHNSSVYQHWDSNDKRSQEFENYQLGYSVISDTQNNMHGTLWNDDAAALVEGNPDKYEYVSAPNYWKGVDY